MLNTSKYCKTMQATTTAKTKRPPMYFESSSVLLFNWPRNCLASLILKSKTSYCCLVDEIRLLVLSSRFCTSYLLPNV